MRSGARAAGVLTRIAFQVDPIRAVLVLLVTPIIGGATAMSGIAVRWFIDTAISRDSAAVVWVAALLTVTVLVMYQLGVIGAEIRMTLQAKISYEIDRRTMTLCVSLPSIDHHENPAYLDRLELLRHRRAELGGAFGALVENFRASVDLTAAVVLLATVHPVLIILPLVAVPTVLASRFQQRLMARADQETAAARRIGEALVDLSCDPAAAREVRIYRLGEEIRDRHSEVVDITRRRRDRAEARGTMAVTAAWTTFAGGLAIAVMVVVAAAIAGRASAGDVALAVVVGSQLASAVTGIAQLVGWLSRALGAAGDYLWLIGHARRVGPGHLPATSSALTRGDLVLESLSFRYPGTSHEVLTDVSLRLPAGTTIALVGENGAGKSTLVKLLCRLYEPSSGLISYGGKPLGQLNMDLWRSRLSACFQDFCRFEFSMRESVGIGDLQGTSHHPVLPSDDAILGAIRTAGADSWARTSANVLDTQLGPAFADGVQPSAGQWQKIALARAGIRTGAAIMVLDEPAASLDPVSEHALVQRYIRAVHAANPDTIVVLVSHRFSTIKHADLIVVLEDGRVQEIGSHDELVARGERYAELHELHAGFYRPAPLPT